MAICLVLQHQASPRLPYENNYYLYRPILYLPLISDTDSRSQKRSGCLSYDYTYIVLMWPVMPVMTFLWLC